MNPMNDGRVTPPQQPMFPGQYPPAGYPPQTGQIPQQIPQGMPYPYQQGMPPYQQQWQNPPQQPMQPVAPTFSKNSLIFFGISIGVVVGISVAVSLLLSLILFLIMFQDGGASVYFGTFAAVLTQSFGAGVGGGDETSAGFILTSTLLIFLFCFLILRSVTKKKPLKRPIDLIMAVAVPSLISAVIITVIVAIITASLDGFGFSWAGLLFGSWFWIALLLLACVRIVPLFNSPSLSAFMNRASEMVMPAIKAYVVALIGFGVVYLIMFTIKLFMEVPEAKIGFMALILMLGRIIVTSPYAMIGTPFSSEDSSVFTWGVGYLIPAIIIMIIMAFVVALALAIYRRGKETWIDLGVLVGTWFFFALLTLWWSLTAGTMMPTKDYLSPLALVTILVFAVVADLLARFVIPYIANVVPVLKNKWPYLTQATQAQKLFGAPAPQQFNQQWQYPQQGYQGYPGYQQPYQGAPVPPQAYPGQPPRNTAPVGSAQQAPTAPAQAPTSAPAQAPQAEAPQAPTPAPTKPPQAPTSQTNGQVPPSPARPFPGHVPQGQPPQGFPGTSNAQGSRHSADVEPDQPSHHDAESASDDSAHTPRHSADAPQQADTDDNA